MMEEYAVNISSKELADLYLKDSKINFLDTLLTFLEKVKKENPDEYKEYIGNFNISVLYAERDNQICNEPKSDNSDADK